MGLVKGKEILGANSRIHRNPGPGQPPPPRPSPIKGEGAKIAAFFPPPLWGLDVYVQRVGGWRRGVSFTSDPPAPGAPLRPVRAALPQSSTAAEIGRAHV